MFRKVFCVLVVIIIMPVVGAFIYPDRGSSFYSSKAFAEENPSLTTNYRSIGTETGNLAGGDSSTAAVAQGLTAVTFSGVVLPTNIGLGDKLTLDPAGVNEVRYIFSRDSATQVTLQSPVQNDHSSGVSYTITRAYNSIQA